MDPWLREALPAWPSLEELLEEEEGRRRGAWKRVYAFLWILGMRVARLQLVGAEFESDREDLVATAVGKVFREMVDNNGRVVRVPPAAEARAMVQALVGGGRRQALKRQKATRRFQPLDVEMDVDAETEREGESEVDHRDVESWQADETSLARKEMAQQLLEGLAPGTQELFHDVYFLGMTVEEAAERNGVRDQLARERLVQGLRRVRSDLGLPMEGRRGVAEGRAKDKDKGKARDGAQVKAKGKKGDGDGCGGDHGGGDSVRFSVFLPEWVGRGGSFVLQAWAYLDSQREEVLQRAMKKAAATVEAAEAGPAEVARGEDLVFQAILEDFEVKESTSTVVWSGSPATVGMRVRVPARLAEGSHEGQVRVLRRGVPVAVLHFDVVVRSVDAADLPTGAEPGRGTSDSASDSASAATAKESRTTPVRTIFASYASHDRPEVITWVRGAEVCGVKVFMDVITLREGQNWEEELWRQVPAKDLFCLFWSKPASESAWVTKEWQCALRERGIEYIHPVPLADPRDVPPPRELSGSKHFNDLLWVLYDYEKGRKQRREDRSATGVGDG